MHQSISPKRPGLHRELPDEKIERSCNSIDGETRDRPGRDDPQRWAFIGVIEPQIRLCAPGFDGQPPEDTDEDDEQVLSQVRTGNDRDGHKPKNADQQPVDIPPPRTIPIDVGKILLGQRPPDVDDQKNRNEKPAQQDRAVAGPDACERDAKRWHRRDYISHGFRPALIRP